MDDVSFGVSLPCMDRRLCQRTIAEAIHDQLGFDLVDHGDGAPVSYCYNITSPGGNDPIGFWNGLRTFAIGGHKLGKQMSLTHVLLSEHDGCAAKNAATHIDPIKGAVAIASVYLTARRIYGDVLPVERPQFHIVRVHTASSSVAEIVDLPGNVWKRARNLGDSNGVRRFLMKFI